jgi:muramidase (phage lysozyme)
MAESSPYLKYVTVNDIPAEQAEANIKNYLDGLGNAEGANYDTIVGGKKFTDYSKHPGVVGITTKEGPSTAAGKYQITKTTYDYYAPKLGIKDFSPESQDKIARAILKDKNAENDIIKGDFDAAHSKLGSTWASLPTSKYSQPKKTNEWVEENIKPVKSGSYTADQIDNIDKPQQVLDRHDSSNVSDDNPYLKYVNQKQEEDNPYLKYVTKEDISPSKSFGKAFVGGITEKIAASPGMAAGAKLGFEAGLKTGRFAPIAAPVLGLAGGIGGYVGGLKAVENVYEKYVPEALKEATGFDKATRQAEIEANPEASFAGELGSNIVLFRPGTLQPITLPGGKVISPLAQRVVLGNVAGGIEVGSQMLSDEELSPQARAQRVGESLLFGAVAAKPTSVTTYADKLAGNIIKKIPGTSEYVPSTRTTQPPRPNINVPPREPAPQQGDMFQTELNQANDLARRGQIFEATEARRSPTDAVIKTEGELDLVKMDAKQSRSKLEESIPDVRNREQITMSIEGQKRQDQLLTDLQKAEQLRILQQSIIKKQDLAREIANRIEAGRSLDDLNRGNTRLSNAYNNLKSKEGFPRNGTPDEQLSFLHADIENTRFGYQKLTERPSDEASFGVRDYVVDEFRRMGEQARREGLLPNMRRDYVTHALNYTDSVLNREQQRSLSDFLYRNTNQSRFERDFTQARQFRYIRDLEKALREAGDALGLDTRGIKVERDIAKIMEIYKNSMGKAIVEKRMVNYLEKTKMDGSPYTGVDTELPILTRDIQLGYRNNYVKFTGQDSEVLEGMLVHPDFKDVLGYAFRQEDPDLMLEALKSVSMLSKFLNTVGSLFHATSLGVASTTAAPGVMIKEIFTGGAGIKAALRNLEHNGVGAQGELLIRNGLKVATEDVQRTVIGDAAGTIDNIVNKYFTQDATKKFARRVSDPLEQHFINHMNRFTWDYMHAGGKLHLAQHFFTQIKAKHPELPDDKIAAEVSSFVNNTLGGLNWLKVVSEVENKFLKGFAQKLMKKENRDWAQIVLFAPDWTVSTLRSFTKALPKELMKPQNWELRKGVKGIIDPTNSNDLARRYVLTTGLLWLTILNGFNYAFTGRPIWTNKDPTRVDLGDGTAIQMAKHSMEAAHWLLDPEKTLGNKLGFIPKAIFTMTTGKQYPSPKAPMVQDMELPFGVTVPGQSTAGRALHSLKAALPFQVSAASSAPPGEGFKRAAFSFIGMPIYGQTNRANTTPEVLGKRKLKRKETRIKNRMKKLEENQ